MEKRFVLRKNKVEQLCLLQKVSKKDISDLLNITQSTFSCKLTGKASCSYDEVYAISNLFDVPFQDIALYSVNISNAELEKASSLMKHSVIDKELFDSLLKKEGLKKTSFAKLLDSSPKSVDRWCGHAGNPKPQTAIAISKYFNIPLKTLFKEGQIIPYSDRKPGKEEMDVLESDNNVEVMDCENRSSASETEVSQLNELNLQTFEEGNVLGNMKVINDNIVSLSNYLISQIALISNQIALLDERMNRVEDDVSCFEFSVNTEADQKNKAKISVILPNSLSDSEVLSICKMDCKQDDYPAYKDKVQKLLAYIGRRKNLVYNQVAHNFYKDFERIYGMSLACMKKGYSKDVNTLFIIYNDKATKEIFYNIVATEASHLAGDSLVIKNKF